MAYPFIQLRASVLAVPSSRFLATPSLLTGGMVSEGHVSAAQQYLKHPRVINMVLVIKPKHSTMTASVINSIPARPSPNILDPSDKEQIKLCI